MQESLLSTNLTRDFFSYSQGTVVDVHRQPAGEIEADPHLLLAFYLSPG